MAPQKSRVPIPKGSANPDQSGSLPIKGTVRQGISTGSQGRPQLKKNVFTRPSNRSRRSGSVPDRFHSPPLTFGPDQNLSDEDRQLHRCTQHRGPSSQNRPQRPKAIRSHLRPSAPLCGANRQEGDPEQKRTQNPQKGHSRAANQGIQLPSRDLQIYMARPVHL